MARGYTRHDWTKLDPLIARLQREGYDEPAIAKDLGIKPSTLRMHLKSRELEGTPQAYPDTPEFLDRPQEVSEPIESEHLGTPESTDMTEVDQNIPEHPGTLEGYHEVMEDVQHSVPEIPHIGTEEVYPSTPEAHQEMSLDNSTMAHSGVPALRDEPISTLPVHPGTPTEEDWDLWTTIKARWLEVEKMLADRQALLGTPMGTPGHTQKKTYVFDVRHIALIDRYAQEHRLDLKDVLSQALKEFFQRRGYTDERA
jgi:hypothetical protein